MNKKNGCGIRDARGSERYTAGSTLGRLPRFLASSLPVLQRPLFTVHCLLFLLLAGTAWGGNANIQAPSTKVVDRIENGDVFRYVVFDGESAVNDVLGFHERHGIL
jgi:hypothetical protein